MICISLVFSQQYPIFVEISSTCTKIYYKTLDVSFFPKGITYFEVSRKKERNYTNIALQQVVFSKIANNKSVDLESKPENVDIWNRRVYP